MVPNYSDLLKDIQNYIDAFQKVLLKAEGENDLKLTVAKALEMFKYLLHQLKSLGKIVSSLAKSVEEFRNNSCGKQKR